MPPVLGLQMLGHHIGQMFCLSFKIWKREPLRPEVQLGVMMENSLQTFQIKSTVWNFYYCGTSIKAKQNI